MMTGAWAPFASFADPVAPPAASAQAPTPRLILRKDSAESELPFWRRKPALRQKIRDERAILVSVRAEDAPNKQIRFLIAGAGAVARSKEFCFRTAQKYDKLKEVSDHFKTVNFDPVTRQLYLVTEALGYEARMILKITPVAEDWRGELQWEVIWGHFKGMKGHIGFEKLTATRTEMSLVSKYEADRLPLPKVLMGFALEVITQKVAEKMRTFIESQAD